MTMAGSVTLAEWCSADPVSHPALAGVQLDTPAVRAVAEELTRSEKLTIVERRDGLQIQATSYVGRISLGHLTIAIQPKLRGTPLLQLFRYAHGFRDLRLFSRGNQPLETDGLQDLLVAQLAAEADDLLRRGIHRTYQRCREELAAPRGRIDFQSLARRGPRLTTGLACTHHPRTFDCLPNQVLHGGLALAVSRTTDQELRARCRRLGTILADSVQERRLDAWVIREALRQNTRLTAAYRPAFRLIGILLGEDGPGFHGGEAMTPLPGFLFDMNRFFQILVGRFLREHLPGCELVDQVGLTDMVTYDAAFNPCHRRNPTPRPDFVVRQEGRVLAILDAKYRDLWERPLPREMLYQLGLYALSGMAGGNATIIYPTLQADAGEQRLNIREPVGGKHLGAVHLRPLDLNRLAWLLRSEGAAAERAKVTLARRLVFGETIG